MNAVQVTRPREPLPTREQLEAITDVPALRDLRDRVEWARQKIEADLEFGPGDDEWAARAIAALTAHRICFGHIDRRIRRLEKRGDRPQPDPVAKEDRKAAKHAAHADRLRAEAEARLTKVERERQALVVQMLAFMRRNSWLAAFHASAARHLDDATLSRISNAAHAAVEASLRAEAPPPAEHDASSSETRSGSDSALATDDPIQNPTPSEDGRP